MNLGANNNPMMEVNPGADRCWNLKIELACYFGAVLLIGQASAQNLLPNPDFKEGGKWPTRWLFVGRGGRSVANARPGKNALMVQGTGIGQNFWRSEGIPLKPGSLYRLSFFGRGDCQAGEGSGFAGLNRVNRDFVPTDSWQRYSHVLCTPAGDTNDFVRFGEWHLKGSVFFSEAELTPVIPIHKRIAQGAELGEAESIHAGVYSFKPAYSWPAGNYHRPLQINQASFNSDRWVFSSGEEIVYRLGLNGFKQVRGTVRASVNYYTGGSLYVEASRDGTNWQSIATYDGRRRGGICEVPSEFFPAEAVFVRLSCRGTNGNLQVNSFEYDAPLARPLPDVEGESHFLEVLQSSPEVAVSVREVQEPDAGGQWKIEGTLTNFTDSPLNIEWASALDSDLLEGTQTRVVERRGHAEWKLACAANGPAARDLTVRFRDDRGNSLFVGRVPVSSSFLSDRRAGYLLPGINNLRVWWCESAWKIGRNRPTPEKPSEPVTVSVARGEFESVQVILSPEKDCRLSSAKIGELRDSHGDATEISSRINEVAYVRVIRPTDPSCLPGWYPDPLPPLSLPLALRAGENQSLWITFYALAEAKAGVFQGELSLETTLGNLSVPVAIHVYDFKLPEQPNLKSAIGLASAEINRYHQLKDAKDKIVVYEKYLLDFAQHRLSPQSLFDYAPIELRFAGEGTNRHAAIDFNRFDVTAEKWLDQHHFTSFRLPLRGIASGSSRNRTQGELDGFKQGTPEHARLFRDYLSQVQRHLSERHWLNKAYAYWFDEPAYENFDFVVAGMDQLKVAAPRVKRLLTITPDPRLLGHVDIWCGLTYKWTSAQISERKAAGEEVWWYICTVPKAPYLTEFIDHPGTEMRLWPWQSWQYAISGILIWNTVYWTSDSAFAEPELQDPWKDPMSYVSGAGLPVGYIGTWGNGDGRFLYPPKGSAGTNAGPSLEGPVNSLRWENLRDGMEDYEYFWLLQQAIERAAAAGMKSSLLQEARQLLTVPPEVSKDLTHFTTDPRPLLAHRDRIARMIENLQDSGKQ